MARTDNRAMWTADRRLYLDKDGKVVEADDPARASLLVAAGASIPRERAEALGLTGGQEPALGGAPEESGPEESGQKAAKAPANKARGPVEGDR